jgi:hypothetical protein
MATKKKTPKTEVTLKADEFSTMLRGFLQKEGACDGDWHEKAMKQVFGITPSRFTVNFEIPYVFRGQATVRAFSPEDAKQQVLDEVSEKVEGRGPAVLPLRRRSGGNRLGGPSSADHQDHPRLTRRNHREVESHPEEDPVNVGPL